MEKSGAPVTSAAVAISEAANAMVVAAVTVSETANDRHANQGVSHERVEGGSVVLATKDEAQASKTDEAGPELEETQTMGGSEHAILKTKARAMEMQSADARIAVAEEE